MLFLHSWLSEYINLSDYNPTQISDLLSLSSGECEEVNTITEYFDNKVVVGRIENLRKHPEADKLNVFDVNIGALGSVQIVSSAPNSRDGLLVPVAIDGAKLPYLTIVPRKMRGLESQGMCCGMSELALETNFSSGLWELNDLVTEVILGQSICAVLPQFFPKDTTYEIKYLQDKLSACANHLGLAMEIAICLQKPELLRGLAKSVYYQEDFYTNLISQIQPATQQIQLTDKTDYVDIYNIFQLELPTSYDLPHIYQQRLFLTGKNLIGGLADLGNYFLYDFGQPNHFFSDKKISNYNWSFDKLLTDTKFQGLGNFKDGVLPKDLVVMKQEEGTKITKDTDSTILIVPGITGSDSTKTDLKDTKVLIEITNFPAQMVARNSFAMGYRSDSAKFFASGVSKYLQLLFLVKLLNEVPTGSVTHNLLWNKGEHITTILDWLEIGFSQTQNTIIVDLEYIATRLDKRNMDYWKPVILNKMAILGTINMLSAEVIGKIYEVEGAELDAEMDLNFYSLTPNAFYGKLNNNDDVLFEIAKLVGFGNLEPEYLTFATDSKTPSYYQTLNNLKKTITNFGYTEVMTRPFLPPHKLVSSILDTPKTALEALSSQRADEPFLRDSLFSQMMETLAKNIKLGRKEPKIFELTKIYTHSDNQPSPFSNRIDKGNTWETWNLSAIAVSEDPYSITSLVYETAKKFELQTVYEKNFGKASLLGDAHTYKLGINGKVEMEIHIIEIKNTHKKTFDIPLTKKVWFIHYKFRPETLTYNPYSKYEDESDYPVVNRSYSLSVPKILELKVVQDIVASMPIQDIKVNFVPTERISQNDLSDTLNFNITFVSYERTLLGEEIEYWNTELLTKIQEICPEVAMR